MLPDHSQIQRVLLLDDRAAYGELVRKYQKEIRTYLVRLTRNFELADDLAQETFLQGYRKLRQLGDPAKFRPWLYSIAHREFLQSLRGRDSETQSPENGAETGADMAAVASIEVESILKSLRTEERSAVLLCLGHEFTHAEAAEALQIPIGTVKSLILRARQKIGEIHEST